MKLKVLSPFQSPGLLVRTEMPVHRPRGYAAFWDSAETAWDELPKSTPWRGRIATLRFTHATPFLGTVGNRYRTIETGSLTRPLHLLEVTPEPSALDLGDLFEEALEDTARKEGADTTPLLAPLVERVRRDPPRLLIRVHDHTISLIEGDLDLGRLLFEIPEAELVQRDGDGESAGEPRLPALDHLQQAAITWAERVTEQCQRTILGPLFGWILSLPESEVYLRGDTATYQAAADPTVAYRPEPPASNGSRRQTSGPSGTAAAGSAPGHVLWVTRTLLFERTDPETGQAEERREAFIRHWLKDVDGADGGKLREVVESPEAYSMRWLNYLFREEAYPARQPEDGRGMTGGRPADPFCRPWEAMLQAQYYYAAFDVLQTRIYRVLAHSFTDESQHELQHLKKHLDEMVKESTLLILDYQENFKYYQRAVHATMTTILRHWGFEKVLLKQVRSAVQACNTRVDELHQRATARSSVYTDLILLAIGVTSVFGILLTLLDYGRTLAHDPTLTVYERGSFNVVDWIAAHSTDGILLVAAIVSGALVGLYFYFKRQQLL